MNITKISYMLLSALIGFIAVSACTRKSTPPRPLRPAQDFALLDQNGQFHQLSRSGSARAVVLVSYGVGCPMVRKYVDALHKIQQQFKDKAVFYWIDGNAQDDPESVARESREFGNRIPVLMDETQLVTRALGFTRTAQALVVDPSS
ncbi:MAG: redoxin family protein, partial [Bdellovibrionales bacterium]